jgi:hypothetical protein
MANTLLTVNQITREALRVLHQKCSFIGSINRQYDDQFANSGAKIGDTLRIRLPNQYTVRSGATLAVQDTVEQNTTLQVATQKGVDLNFTSNDMTLSLDSFSERIISPAMAVLAAAMEADALSMVNDVYNSVGTYNAAMTYKTLLQGRKRMTDELAPSGDRKLLLNTTHNLEVVDALKGLFQDSSEIGKQYREGLVGKTAGFGNIFENTILPDFTSGAGTGYLVNGAAQSGAGLIVDTGTGALPQGTVFTIAGVFRVHPETKQTTAVLQQFVVTATHSGGAGTVAISPSIVATGGRQNVSAVPADNAAITVFGAASSSWGQSLAFHKDAFTFATADLVMPKGVDFAAREVYDGLSMRIVRAYDINNDQFPCRLDVLYGWKTLRAQLACRLAGLQ